MKGDLFIVIVL